MNVLSVSTNTFVTEQVRTID